MVEANDHFRAARERAASPTHQGMSLTRQELAELVNTWVWEHHNTTVVVTAHYIGRLETGIIRWPTALYREALRAILGVSNDAALGFINARSRRAAVRLERVNRRNLIRGGAALSVSTLAAARHTGTRGLGRRRHDPLPPGRRQPPRAIPPRYRAPAAR